MHLSHCRLAPGLICLAACAWAVLLFDAPLLSRQAPGSAPVRLAAATYVAGSLVCHQRTERSFRVAGGQLPVCARCTALYVSGAAGLVFGWAAAGRGRRRNAWDAGSRVSWRWLLIAASLPLLASVAAEALGWWHGSNAWRAASAIPSGSAVGVMLIESLSFQGRL